MISDLSGRTLLLAAPILLGVYFLPSLLALLFNRRDKRKILVANIPAGFSFVLWFGVLAWALTGRREEPAS